METTTTPPPVYGEFGQALGQAERTLSAILRQHLAQRGVEPEAWFALKLLAQAGQAGLGRDELVERLVNPPSFASDAADRVLGELETDGTADAVAGTLRLTAAGQARYDDLRAYVAGPSVALFGAFPLSDLETTVRTLQAITERARAA